MDDQLGAVVRIFGRLRCGDGYVASPVGTPAALLRMVATYGAVHVDEACEALWPDAPADAGRARLRNVLSRLRAGCGHLLVRDGDTVALADGVVVDLALFDAYARRALGSGEGDEHVEELAKRALAMSAEILLPEDLYRDWAAAPRERVRRHRLALLDLLAARAVARGDVAAAERRWQEAIDLEPYDEARYVAAARGLRQAGRWGTAHCLLDRAEAALAALGLAPTPDLLVLREQLYTADAG